MTFDRIDRMVREANPVPDLAALEPVDSSDLLDQWRNNMQVDSNDRKVDNTGGRRDGPVRDMTTRRPPQFRWVAALGAVAVVIVAAAIILPDVTGGILGGDSPVAVAERYMAARSALDAEAAVAELSPDAELADVPYTGDIDDVDQVFAYLAVLDNEVTEYACSASQQDLASEPVAVRCSYRFDTNLSQALDVEPVDGEFAFLVEEGKITNLAHLFNFAEYSPKVFEVFIDWLDENHPGVNDSMWVEAPDFSQVMFNHEEASLEDLERYIAEFEAAQR